MTGSLLLFEKGVPIDDLAVSEPQRRSLQRVQHVYWQWIRNPYLVDYKALLKQMVKGKYASRGAEHNAAQRDIQLFEFVKESVTPMSRKEAQVKVLAAAEKAVRIGMETDNVQALTKGGKLLYEVAGLDKPENEQMDMAKTSFLPSVVVTNIKEVDETKADFDYDDAETKRIMSKYGAYIDPTRKMIDDRVAQMMAAHKTPEESTETEENDEQDRQ